MAGSGGSGCVSVESEGEHNEDSETEDHEQTAVRFKVEEEGTGDDKMRLHRRDTPHHLKNKRINQQVSSLNMHDRQFNCYYYTNEATLLLF